MEKTAVVSYTSSFLSEFTDLNLYILIPVFVAVIALSIGYFKNYHAPAEWLRKQLITLITSIKETREVKGLSKAELKAKLDEIFGASPFKNIWSEYTGSLHVVYKTDNHSEIKDIYATTPSETFFSKETLIDLQINAGFYRHLPGILTSIGIVGTFTGLVWGLREFRLDAGLALESLPMLLQEVASAFIGSGFAIFVSVFITYKEKDILNKCYMLVEELNKELDSTYSMGAGEEYLARLVNMSEKNNHGWQKFREDVMSDLISILNESAEKQVTSQQIQNQMVADQIASAIKTAITEPMEILTEALKEVRGDQREAVSTVLETLVDGFMEKLGDTVGTQMEEINASIQNSSAALDKVQAAMMASIDGITSAGASAAGEMSAKIENTFERIMNDQQQANARLMEAQKQTVEEMDDTMKTVLSSIQDAVVSFAIDRKQQMAQHQDSYEKLISSVNNAVTAIASDRKEQIEQDKERTDKMMSSVQVLYSDLSSGIGRITTDIRDITITTSDNFAKLQSMTEQSLSQMKESIGVMQGAASSFSNVGDKVESVALYMTTAAETMSKASETMQQAFEEYDKMRSSIQIQVAHLQNLVETTRKESVISQKVVDDIAVVAATLERAGKQSTEHMEQVNTVLKQAFEDFGGEMVKQVRNISSESNRQLETSLVALSGTVDSMVASVTKLRRAA